jgi:hypothetical protein
LATPQLIQLLHACRLGAAGAILLAALLLAGCTDDTPDYRYRLTVEVETPQGLRTGSSVIAVEQTLVSPGSNPAGQGVERRVRGEAVAVDLPGGRTLFALLRSDNNIDWAGYVMPLRAPKQPGESFAEELDNMLALKGRGPIALPRNSPPVGHLPERSAYAMVVTFRDTGDPTSVELVDPDDLAATFRPGTKLKRITVEMTEDAVTSGIEERLSQPDSEGFFNWDGKSNPNDRFVVSMSDFITGRQQ